MFLLDAVFAMNDVNDVRTVSFLYVLYLDAVFAVNDVIDVRPVSLTHLVFSLCLGLCVCCE